MEELRKSLTPSWRRTLNYARKIAKRNGIKLIEGSDDELYESLSVVYNEMLARKRFIPGTDIKEFQLIQKDLPDSFKMKVIICELENKPAAAMLGSLIGNTGLYLLGATGNNGLKISGSYLLQWRMIEWLKEHGARWYDLNGFNPEKNPSIARFKAGLAGREVYHIGQFEACQSLMSSFLVKSGDQLRMTTQEIRHALNRMRNMIFC
jgi:hypothetical protein